MRSPSVSSVPLSDSIGAEFPKIVLENLSDENTRAAIRQAWLEHGLLLFRNALSSADTHLLLSRVFGDMEPSATAHLNSVENPFLMELRQTPNNPKARRYLVGGEERIGFIGWHWDQAFMPKIVRGAVLRMVEPAHSGGRTGFIDAIAAYDRLTEDMKLRIADLEVVYEFSPAMDTVRGYPHDVVAAHPSEPSSVYNFPPVVHPLVITQPETGRKVLKLSPLHSRYILDMDRAASDRLLTELADHLTDDRYAYNHRWDRDDVLIWDNWRLIHCAEGVPEGVARLGVRTTIAGDYNAGRYLDPTLDPDNPPERFDD
ncbi:TauD/TfdA dioxygenase family protein [Rhodococcus rhodochrous]|uniref:TauD/TfdA-like domain-containing protein n=1 Tax=Rhodococcus rhodochrous KG-21 TaxID=1441923 RepID=A0A0M8PQU8_RHORH|nr:TauD/TfdA family dioxygenase [Rhodococcus rhodochrous]KOS56698.1 hypothetical protein Z051_08195 [Rhodococcus rhodochrous KG-21]